MIKGCREVDLFRLENRHKALFPALSFFSCVNVGHSKQWCCKPQTDLHERIWGRECSQLAYSAVGCSKENQASGRKLNPANILSVIIILKTSGWPLEDPG